MLSRSELLAEGLKLRDTALALIASEGEAMDYGAALSGPSWRARGCLFIRFRPSVVPAGNYELARRQHGVDFEGLDEALNIHDIERQEPVFQILWNTHRHEVAMLRRGAWLERMGIVLGEGLT